MDTIVASFTATVAAINLHEYFRTNKLNNHRSYVHLRRSIEHQFECI
ncbi:hypothetical protein [Bdellovibrio sp. HCB274]